MAVTDRHNTLILGTFLRGVKKIFFGGREIPCAAPHFYHDRVSIKRLSDKDLLPAENP